MPVNMKITGMSCQQLDGSENFSTYGVRATQNIGKFNLAGEVGVAITYTDNSTGIYADIRGALPYGDTCLNGGFRLRSREGKTQIRLQPASISFKAGEKTSLYATPYAQTSLNYSTGKFDDPQIGGFAGVSHQFSKKFGAFAEVQCYDLTDVQSKSTSINVGVSLTI